MDDVLDTGGMMDDVLEQQGSHNSSTDTGGMMDGVLEEDKWERSSISPSLSHGTEIGISSLSVHDPPPLVPTPPSSPHND